MQWLILDAALQRPPGGVERGFCERVAFEERQPLLQVGTGRDVLADKLRREPIAAQREDAVGPFRAVARRGERSALAPGVDRATGHAAEDRINRRVLAIGGSPRRDQRHGDMKQINAVDVHGQPFVSLLFPRGELLKK